MKRGAPPPGPDPLAGRQRPPALTAGHLAHDANFHHRRRGPAPATEGPPAGLDEPLTPAGPLPGARPRPDLQLPETELRPPDFLGPAAAMRDVYQRTRGRMSRRTKELLEGPDLEDLLGLLRKIFEVDALERHPEARLRPALHAQLRADPGPLLLGLGDPRLIEPWRLLLDRWDIWVPEGEGGGVELFWEGEAEDDAGDTVPMIQSLLFRKGELVLHTRLGAEEDRLTFDGEAFYRLRHER